MEVIELFLQTLLLFGEKRSRPIIFFVSLALVSVAHWRVLFFLGLPKARQLTLTSGCSAVHQASPDSLGSGTHRRAHLLRRHVVSLLHDRAIN